ncbi:MAG: hypothetical protein GXP49_18235 [Deltaproteobacteria bacterium]|nr:hypothetical protein [Deltaproteobacteria bacterium]
MSETLSLLKPKIKSASRHLQIGKLAAVVRNMVFLSIGAGFWAATFMLTKWFIGLTRGEAALVGLADVLVEKLLALTFLVFLAILLFSNVITAFSTIFLSDDLELVGQLPVSTMGMFSARFIETVFSSSWMVILFGSPVFIACGVAYSSPLTYYAWACIALFLFILIPAGIGVMLSLILAAYFPARRTHALLLVVSVAVLVVLFLLFRFLEPEKLIDPASGFRGLGEFLHSFQSPNQSWLPSYWAAETLFPRLRGETGRSWSYLAALAGWAAGVTLCTNLLARALYKKGLSKTKEGNRSRPFASFFVDTAARSAARLTPRIFRPIARKDVKTFFRDASQWSQVLLLGALIAIYIFNFKSFKAVKISGMLGDYFLYFLNLGLGGFVIAAVAVRFVYPSISLEGKAFWVIKTAPIRLNTFLRGKLFISILPLVALGAGLSLGSGLMLELNPVLFVFSMISSVALATSLTVLAVGIGAMYPAFDAENAAKVAGSFGGVVYMILAGGYLVLFIAGQVLFVPALCLYFEKGDTSMLLADGLKTAIGICMMLLSLALSLTLPMKLGIKKLHAS